MTDGTGLSDARLSEDRPSDGRRSADGHGQQSTGRQSANGGTRFGRVLTRVLLVQIVALALLWALQATFGLR